jgi:NAD(P)-dependent dehydrogenase (short-subunit alcohol dehydrogenase family)
VTDIAAAVAFLASADGEWINGQVISVDGGVSMR